MNATGIGAKTLVPDENIEAIRGQTCLIRGVAPGLITRLGKKPGETIVIMPRPQDGTSVVGVTREGGVWDVEVHEEVTEQLVEGARAFWEMNMGETKDMEVLKSQVGLRPGRKGGARVEREKVGRWQVVHAYGHAGAGYQNSLGCANSVVRLVGECEKEV